MAKQKKLVRVVCAVLALLMAATLVLPALSRAFADDETPAEKLERLRKEIAALHDQIEASEENEQNAQQTKLYYQQLSNTLSAQLEALQEDIDVRKSDLEKKNLAIAQAGMEGSWGANVGRTLRQVYGEDVRFLARAFAAAGSDARMSGCEMPVIIVSGSGNQGITASVPVAVYAKAVGADRERLLRAVTLSDLVTIHQKTGIGCLSAFCGATCAGCGAGAGIAYLLGGDYKTVAHTIVNALAVVSGMVCDGAKASCAAKIAAAIDAGILGYELYCHGQEFLDGDGIIRKGVDNTIGNVGRMARSGMRETDRVILDIMCGC